MGVFSFKYVERGKDIKKFLDMCFPQSCGICGKLIEKPLCRKCEIKLKKEAIFGKDKYQDKYFENHFYIFNYSDLIRKLILDYKFNEKAYLYKTFTFFFEKFYKQYFKFNNYDSIIPVPIGRKRKKERGYNQSLLIAKDISKNLNAKLLKDVLIKSKNNIAQSSLDKLRKGKKCFKCI